MRVIQTFVLRLLTNPDEPLALRGMLHAVASGEEQPFKDETALLALLRQAQGKPAGAISPEGGKSSHKEADER